MKGMFIWKKKRRRNREKEEEEEKKTSSMTQWKSDVCSQLSLKKRRMEVDL
jgi:hypothetical protein